MAVVRFRSTVWNTPRRQPILKYLSAALLLGTPASYRIGPGAGQEWLIFSDIRFTLDQVANLAAVVGLGLGQLPNPWVIPTIIDDEGNDTGIIDREAAEAKVLALVEDDVVLSADIDYAEDDQNVWQTTIDAQSGVPATVAAEPAPGVDWRPA